MQQKSDERKYCFVIPPTEQWNHEPNDIEILFASRTVANVAYAQNRRFNRGNSARGHCIRLQHRTAARADR
jgi:hypothetical protein